MSTGTGFAVTPSELGFDKTVVGGEAQGFVELTSTSRARQTLTLHSRGPFRAAGEYLLEAGARAPLQVTFAPVEAGAASGTLTIEGDSHSTQVALWGEGVAPSGCPEDTACLHFAFDRQTGACVAVASPNGASCANPCLTDGVCSSGICVGQPTRCDDANACTTDACDTRSGCVHLDASASCPTSNDPCLAPFCDPANGCGLGVVADGTSCGASDCATSRVCIAGQCSTRPTPEGASCGVASPCRPAGACRNQVCVQGPAQVLAPTWTQTVAPNSTRLDFPGVVDPQGNLYWSECRAGCELVSVTASGTPRFRATVAVGSASSSAYSDFVVTVRWVVLADPGGDIVEAHDTQTGALVWRRRLRQELDPLYRSPTCTGLPSSSVHSWPLLSDGSGQLVVFTNVGGSAACGSPNTKDIWVIALDTATGVTRWKRRYAVNPHHENDVDAAFDEAGNLYATFRYPTPSQTTLLSLSGNGTERWRRSFLGGARRISGLFAGSLVLTGYQQAMLLIDSSTGSDRFSYRPLYAPVSALVDSTQAIVLATDGRGAPFTLLSARLGQGTSTESTLRNGTGQTLSRVSVPVMTSRSTFVLASKSNLGWRLGEFDFNGALRFECELAPHDYGAPTLRAGRWTAAYPEFGPHTIVSFEVPGLEPAASGWVTARGKVSKEGRPR